jgi:HEPN domain-containing protein
VTHSTQSGRLYAPYDAFKAGLVTASLISAEQALSTAASSAMSLLGYDHPFTREIREAHDQVSAARQMESRINEDAMTGRLRR